MQKLDWSAVAHWLWRASVLSALVWVGSELQGIKESMPEALSRQVEEQIGSIATEVGQINSTLDDIKSKADAIESYAGAIETHTGAIESNTDR